MLDEEFAEPEQPRHWTTALVMFIALILLFVVFIWAFVRLEPLLSDVVPGATATPTVIDATPTLAP